jgi:prepilin-type N-terminal cleavage/methylation domain-containing protein
VLGFSLVELLVVISIVSVLTAILLPAVGRARETARRAMCGSQMRQMYLSYSTYAADFKGYYMGIVGYNGVSDDSSYSTTYVSGWDWARSTSNAVRNYMPKQATLCPSAKRVASEREWKSTTYTGGPMLHGITDYSLKAGFASNHRIGTSSTGYSIDLDCQSNNNKRGILQNNRYKHWKKGFFFNFREEGQERFHKDFKPQSGYSLMFVDRHMSPNQTNWVGTQYATVSNHALPGSIGAEGANAMMKNGAVRWMNLVNVWSTNDTTSSPYFYGTSAYAEGQVRHFVDDFIADQMNQ